MLEHYKTIYEGGEGELVEKKSRFIATVRPVETEEEALAFIEEMKKKYWDARHNCYVYSQTDPLQEVLPASETPPAALQRRSPKHISPVQHSLHAYFQYPSITSLFSFSPITIMIS